MATWWTLKIVSGAGAGKTFPLNPIRTVIGRVKGDVVLGEDNEASTIHCDISYDSNRGTLTIQDLKSRNGVRLNGTKTEKAFLKAGDRIRIGSTELILEPPRTDDSLLAKTSAPSAPKPLEPVERAKQVPALQVAARSPLPKLRQFDSFFKKFLGVLFYPKEFFDYLGDDIALKPAIKFAVLNWFVGGTFAGVLSYYFLYIVKSNAGIVDFGNSPMALALGTVLGFMFLPLVALTLHFLNLILGGHAPFTRAIQICCYLSSLHFMVVILGVIPKIGPFLGTLGSLYFIYLWSIASMRLYLVIPFRAYATAAILVACTTVTSLYIHTSAEKTGAEIAKQIKPTKAPASTAIPPLEPGQAPEQRDPAGSGDPTPPTLPTPVQVD